MKSQCDPQIQKIPNAAVHVYKHNYSKLGDSPESCQPGNLPYTKEKKKDILSQIR